MSKLTKQDINKARILSFIYQWQSFNFETMQSGGFVQSIAPAIVKLHEGDNELIAKKLDTYLMTFYNTEATMAQLIHGACLAVEEASPEDPEITTTTVTALKTSLMGPFAGLGDSIFKVSAKVIFGSMAGYMALENNLVGMFLCVGVMIFTNICRVLFFNAGYKEGVSFITSRQDQIKSITNSVVVLGLVVIGTMIPSTVKLTIPYVFKLNDASQSIQALLDGIFPYLLPVTATFLIYKGLKIKGMTTVRMVWLIIAIVLVLTYFKVL